MKGRDAQVHLCGAASVMVILPGALMTPAQMVEAGMFDAVRVRRLALDLVVPDLQASVDDDRAALECLERRWLAPARACYQRVWLGGISRGAQLALAFLAARAGRVDGLCLLAPYAGSRLVTNTIRRCGGIDAWQPGEEQLRDPDYRLWHWLKRPLVGVPMFIGYGEQDRFADGMRMLAERLPDAAHITLPGAHDWSAWLTLWARFLELRHFPALP